MSEDKGNSIPASLLIGRTSIMESGEFDLPLAIRRIERRYEDYIKNQKDWEHNDTRELIIIMMITIENLNGELEKSNKIFQELKGEMSCRVDHGADSNGHLEGLLGLIKGWGS